MQNRGFASSLDRKGLGERVLVLSPCQVEQKMLRSGEPKGSWFEIYIDGVWPVQDLSFVMKKI